MMSACEHELCADDGQRRRGAVAGKGNGKRELGFVRPTNAADASRVLFDGSCRSSLQGRHGDCIFDRL